MMGSAGFMGGATGALSAIPGWGWLLWPLPPSLEWAKVSM